MNRIATLLLAVFLISTTLYAASASDRASESTGNDQQIVFLRFHADSGGISFVGADMAVGTLKAHRAESLSGDIYYEVESTGGTVLSSGSIDDPLKKRLEYEDPDSTGVIRSTMVQLDEAEFIVRLRYDSEMNAVSFYRTINADGKREVDKANRISRTTITLGAEEDR